MASYELWIDVKYDKNGVRSMYGSVAFEDVPISFVRIEALKILRRSGKTSGEIRTLGHNALVELISIKNGAKVLNESGVWKPISESTGKIIRV